MKNPFEVMRGKELEIIQIKKEIQALRIAAPLLADEQSTEPRSNSDHSQVLEMP